MKRARGDLRYLRSIHFWEGIHFQRKNHDEVLLSAEAVGLVLRYLGAKLSELNLEDCLPAKKTSTGLQTMRIVRIPFNPRMVLACFDGDTVEHLVDVGRNATFAIDDQIEVADHETMKGICQLRSPVPRDSRRPR